jgi:hypothetical protein
MKAIFAFVIAIGGLFSGVAQAQTPTLDGSETYQVVSAVHVHDVIERKFVFLHREPDHPPVQIIAWCESSMANTTKPVLSEDCDYIDVGSTIAVTSVLFIPDNGGGGKLSDPAGWAVEKEHDHLVFMHGVGAGFVREDFLIEKEEVLTR